MTHESQKTREAKSKQDESIDKSKDAEIETAEFMFLKGLPSLQKLPSVCLGKPIIEPNSLE
jgi:bacterioferritin (cytochrome b1)